LGDILSNGDYSRLGDVGVITRCRDDGLGKEGRCIRGGVGSNFVTGLVDLAELGIRTTRGRSGYRTLGDQEGTDENGRTGRGDAHSDAREDGFVL
jgi:hypothetical protein